MKYKILKHISGPTFRSWNEGDIVEVDYGCPILVSDGIKISLSELIEQGFIEEVKETPHPRWKVGDCVVKEYKQGYNEDYISIFHITMEMGTFKYNNVFGEGDLRDPTPDELATYFI